MYTIIHNARCSKSREALKTLQDSDNPFTIREYLKEALTFQELDEILQKLNVEPMDIIRTNEAEWKEFFQNQDLSRDELIQAMVDYPKLIQRPIVVDEKGGVVGRPLENVHAFIQ